MGILSIINYSQGSNLELFFRWLHMGSIIDIIYASHSVIMAILTTIFLTQWVRDWRILAFIGVLLVVFFQFVL